MLKKAIWGLTAITALAAFDLHAATLNLGRGIELLVVDGEKYESPVGYTPETSLELADGNHQLLIRFNQQYKENSRTKHFTSKPYIFQLDLQGRDAEISSLPLRTRSQAQAYFARSPQWQLTYANGEVVTLNTAEIEGKGLAPFSNLEKLVADYNQANGIAMVKGNPVDLEKVAVQVTEQGEVKVTGDALTQLKMWYTKASDKDKKAFKIWMAEQEFN